MSLLISNLNSVYNIPMMDWLVKPRQRVKFEGKYNFQLLLNTEHVDSSSTISITCFTDKNQRAAVPCNYIWFIIKNGLPQQITNFKGCTFICDTSHIGYYIQAHIISNDADYSGKAIVTFGPVELDVSLKTGILSALSTGLLELPIYFIGPEQQQKQGTLQLYDSQIKLIHNYSEANYIFDYSIVEPQITPSSREITKATINFNEKYEAEMRRFQRRLFSTNELTSSKSSSCMNMSKSNFRINSHSQSLAKLQIRFLSRQARDSFFFTVKAFIAKKELRNSAIVRKIENINFQKEEDFTAILELDNLKSDLIRYDKLYKQTQIEKKKLQDEYSRIQREYAERYSRPGDMSMNVNYSAATRRDDPIMLSKINKLEENNMQLNMKIMKLNNELDQARGNSSVIMKPQMTLSPFTKKREDDNQSLADLLEDLSRCDPQKQIQNLQQEKKTLEIKLQRSFEKINLLENRLKGTTSINSPASAVNFTYKYNTTSSSDYSKIIERLRSENEELQRANTALQNQNRMLNARIDKQMRAKNESKLESHLTKIRQQNRTTDLLIESRAENEKIIKLSHQVEELTSTLKRKEEELQKVFEKCINLQRKLHEAQLEVQMHRKNQDVLNRSQHMSIQMENYNQEQIKMLKEHNDFLIEENEKLVKACEKYMADARQNNALRKEILQLKEKITHLRTNPETSSFT